MDDDDDDDYGGIPDEDLMLAFSQLTETTAATSSKTTTLRHDQSANSSGLGRSYFPTKSSLNTASKLTKVRPELLSAGRLWLDAPSLSDLA
jgi:hypothetical protein